MLRGRAFSLLLRLLPIAVATALPDPVRAASPAPTLSPWLKIVPGDARIGSLAAKAAAPLSPNAPGLLLKLDPPGWKAGNAAAREAVRALAVDAHRAGWRWGLDLELPDVTIPADVRAAESATVENLWPGLGEIFRDAKETDLVTIEFPQTIVPGIPEAGRPREGAFDPKARAYLLRKVASGARAAAPHARLVLAAGPLARRELLPAGVRKLLSEENTAYVDFLGATPLAPPRPGEVRVAIDDVAFGKPGLVDLDFSGVRSPGALLAAAARLAPENVPFVVASPAWPPAGDAALERFAHLLDGDFGPDSRVATASDASGEALDVVRFVARTDLGGVVLIPGTAPAGGVASGAFSLTLDETAYASAEVFELETGASKSFDIPAGAVPTRLSLSLANGPLGVRLVAREKLPSEAAVAAVGVAATRGLTAEEILARHQAWRAARDARWKNLTARNTMSMRFRFAELNDTFDLALAGPFFYEKGGSYDWAWSEAYFNGVRWKGKKIPELPLLQPQKVSDMPLALTFDDAYAYTLAGEDTVNGIPCWVLDFTPRAAASDKPLYAGTVWIAKADFAAIRTRTRQLNLTAEIQAVDEVSDFGEVPASDGGPPLRLPTHTTGQWILKTFSRTTVIERESTLTDVRLDVPEFAAARQAAFASPDVMVRDTEKGVRYLEKTADGGRVVTENAKPSKLFGLGGLFYDGSYDYPLPLLGLYYVDLDFRDRHEQLQVFFAGILLSASYNQPRLFGTALDAGVECRSEEARLVIRGGEKDSREEDLQLLVPVAEIEVDVVEPEKREGIVVRAVVEETPQAEQLAGLCVLGDDASAVRRLLEITHAFFRVAHHDVRRCKSRLARGREFGHVEPHVRERALALDDGRPREGFQDPLSGGVRREAQRRPAVGRGHLAEVGDLVHGLDLGREVELPRAGADRREVRFRDPDRASIERLVGSGGARREVEHPAGDAVHGVLARERVCVGVVEGQGERHVRDLLGLEERQLGDFLSLPAHAVEVRLAPGPVVAAALLVEERPREREVERVVQFREAKAHRHRVAGGEVLPPRVARRAPGLVPCEDFLGREAACRRDADGGHRGLRRELLPRDKPHAERTVREGERQARGHGAGRDVEALGGARLELEDLGRGVRRLVERQRERSGRDAARGRRPRYQNDAAEIGSRDESEHVERFAARVRGRCHAGIGSEVSVEEMREALEGGVPPRRPRGRRDDERDVLRREARRGGEQRAGGADAREIEVDEPGLSERDVVDRDTDLAGSRRCERGRAEKVDVGRVFF